MGTSTWRHFALSKLRHVRTVEANDVQHLCRTKGNAAQLGHVSWLAAISRYGHRRGVEGTSQALSGQSATSQAMEDYEERVTILVADNIRNGLDMLDEQPASVIEAVTERAKRSINLAAGRNTDTNCGPPLSNTSKSVCTRRGRGSAAWRRP
jgi:hypothetical protein